MAYSKENIPENYPQNIRKNYLEKMFKMMDEAYELLLDEQDVLVNQLVAEAVDTFCVNLREIRKKLYLDNELDRGEIDGIRGSKEHFSAVLLSRYGEKGRCFSPIRSRDELYFYYPKSNTTEELPIRSTREGGVMSPKELFSLVTSNRETDE